jgi:hypothetical protein
LRPPQDLEGRRQLGRVERGVSEEREQRRQLGVTLGQQVGRAPEQGAGRGGVAALERPPPCLRQQTPGPQRERPRMLVFRPELDSVSVGLLEVVPEDLAGRVAAERRLQPIPEALVQVGPEPLRDRIVRGVPDQDVAEAEAVVARKRRPVGPDQLLPDERQQMRVDPRPRLLGKQLDDGASVEQPPFDRRPFDHCSLLGLEPVDPRGEQRLDRRRDLQLAVFALRLHRDELLHEERVPLGGLDNPGLGVGGKLVQLLDQRLRLFARKRLERDQRRVRPWRRPDRAPLEEVGPSDTEQEQGRVLGERRDVVDQVEQRRLGPVNVVEDDDQRLRARECLEELPKAPRDLLGRGGRLGGSDRRGNTRGGDLGVTAVSEHASHVVHLRDDLGERPVRDAFPVGEAAADEDARLRALDQLAREPRLADPGRPHDRRELRRALVDRAGERALQDLELRLAADKRRSDRTGEGWHVGKQLEQAVGSYRLRLPLQRQRLDRLVLDGVADKDMRSFAEQDLARSRRLFQAGGDVDGVPRDERPAGAGDDLARVDADAGPEAERCHRIPGLPRRSNRAQRVVLVGLRNPEHRHRRVTDELLDGPPVTLEDRPQLAVVPRHQLAEQFRICAVAERGPADDVAEEDRDGLADPGPRVGGERRRARVAKPRAVGVVLPTLGADHWGEA